jgi:hypothetical protein
MCSPKIEEAPRNWMAALKAEAIAKLVPIKRGSNILTSGMENRGSGPEVAILTGQG